MNEFVDNLDFTHVKIDTAESDKEALVIDFTLNDYFDFFTIIRNDTMNTKEIRHYFKEDNICPFCEERTKSYSKTSCKNLTVYIQKIERLLLNHPSIRLKLLFL